MACPDELTLDLWQAAALPAEEAAGVARHVATCTECTARQAAWHAASATLKSALQLDADERAYLVSLALPTAWHTRPRADSARWGWIALIGTLAAFGAWILMAPLVGAALGVAFQIGMGTVLIDLALGVLFRMGQALIATAVSPALSVSQPFLAALALAILFLPRLLSRPSPQGVLS